VPIIGKKVFDRYGDLRKFPKCLFLGGGRRELENRGRLGKRTGGLGLRRSNNGISSNSGKKELTRRKARVLCPVKEENWEASLLGEDQAPGRGGCCRENWHSYKEGHSAYPLEARKPKGRGNLTGLAEAPGSIRKSTGNREDRQYDGSLTLRRGIGGVGAENIN